MSTKPLDEYLCSYFLPGDQAILYFKCSAEDEEHAEEQLLNAEPSATSVYCEVNRNRLTEKFDNSVDEATHAVIAAFEWMPRLPQGDALGDLMVEINDAIAAIMRDHKG